MGRYSTTLIKKEDSGKRRRRTTIFPVIPRSTNDVYIKTTTSERLDKLAYTFYEDISMWWVIASANGIGKGTFIVPSNTNIRIPDKNNVIDFLIETNNTR